MLSNTDSLCAKDLPLEIQTLITMFDALFQTPQTLPSVRDIDHHIHLFPQSAPVNVWPYRYPHYQQQEIEL